MSVDGGGILWDACPLISLCVCARAGCVKQRERRRRRAHTLLQKHGNILKIVV